jgi:metal-dependent amidase/aminoacylase/carboxypeptidase family protein
LARLSSPHPRTTRSSHGCTGRAAHARVEPERGISALAAAAEAIAQLQRGHLDATTTANIGTIRGGSVRPAVPAELELDGEVRSLAEDRFADVAESIETTYRSCASQRYGTGLRRGQVAAATGRHRPAAHCCRSATACGHAGGCSRRRPTAARSTRCSTSRAICTTRESS